MKIKTCCICEKKPREISGRPYCYDCYYKKREKWKVKISRYNPPKAKVDSLEGEKWRTIPGYDNMYMASNLGRVKSMRRIIISKGIEIRLSEKLRSPTTVGGGYKAITLHKCGSFKSMMVHRAVISAFKGEKTQLVVDHIDSDRKNNKLSNLRYCTYRQNTSFYRTKKYNSSQYTGVSWVKGLSKWSVKIRSKNKSFHIGHFKNEIEASLAYIGVSKLTTFFEKQINEKKIR